MLRRYGLDQEEIIIRMTGCPNGCARPYIAEIGLVGTAPGLYNLHLGGDHEGMRLNKIYKESMDEENGQKNSRVAWGPIAGFGGQVTRSCSFSGSFAILFFDYLSVPFPPFPLDGPFPLFSRGMPLVGKFREGPRPGKVGPTLRMGFDIRSSPRHTSAVASEA